MKTKKNIYFFTLLCTVSLLCFSQSHHEDEDAELPDNEDIDWPCDSIVHGYIPRIHMDCTEDILITSLEEEPKTVIGGIITTTGHIRIIPGHNGVRIIPHPDDDSGDTDTHTTKIGNGNTGNRSFAKNTTPPIKQHTSVNLKELRVFPNPFEDRIQMQTQMGYITGYQLGNLYGSVIQEAAIQPTKSYSFFIDNIKSGVYVLTIQLSNGKAVVKKLLKTNQ